MKNTNQRIRISDFKALGAVDISLKNLTYLVGSNSVGKSSISQALLFAIQSLQDRSEDTFLANGELISLGASADLLRKGANTFSITIPVKRIAKDRGTGSFVDGHLKLTPSSKINGSLTTASLVKPIQYDLTVQLGRDSWNVRTLNQKYKQVTHFRGTTEISRTLVNSRGDQLAALADFGKPDSKYSLRESLFECGRVFDSLKNREQISTGSRVVNISDAEAVIVASHVIGPVSWQGNKPNLMRWFDEFEKLWSKGLVEYETYSSKKYHQDLRVPLGIDESEIKIMMALRPEDEDGASDSYYDFESNDDFELNTESEVYVNYSSEYLLQYVPSQNVNIANLIYDVVRRLEDGKLKARPMSFQGHSPVETFFKSTKVLNQFEFLPESFEFAFSFLGPLRQDGFAQAKSWPSKTNFFPVGIKGENAAFSLLSEDENFQTGKPKEKKFRFSFTHEELKILSTFVMEVENDISHERSKFLPYPLPDGKTTHQLFVAVDSWLEYMGIGGDLRIQDLGVHGFEISLRGRKLFELGSGVAQILPVIAICLLSSGETVFIEQPELHLHPAAQQLMGDFFAAVARSGRRVFIETHSEYLVTRARRSLALKQLRQSQIQLLFAEQSDRGTRVSTAGLTSKGGYKYWPDGFFAELDDDILDILKSLKD